MHAFEDDQKFINTLSSDCTKMRFVLSLPCRAVCCKKSTINTDLDNELEA